VKIMTENTCAVFTLKDLARTAYIECNEVVYRIWKWCKREEKISSGFLEEL